MPSPKKTGLALLLGMAGPKSKNPNGVEDASITAPDQSGDMLAPGGEMEDEMTETMEAMAPPSPNSILLPPGFKPPDGAEEEFMTTIRGKVMGDRLEIVALGDMPLDGPAVEEVAPLPEEEVVEQEEVMEMEPESDYAKKRSEERAAKKAFQGM